MQDYNGIEIPKKVQSTKVNIEISIEYIGKYGTPENIIIEDCNLEDWNSMEDALRTFEIEYNTH